MMKKKIGIAIMFLSVVMGTIFVPAYSVYATVDTTDYNDYEARLQTCSLGLIGQSNFGACLVEGIYYIVLVPSAWFARVTGELFDYFVQYSLDTNSYRGHGNFIERGWSIVRDIGNVLFIFALLYIAITHILQAGTSGTKKFLINLIIAALLINFSLFFSRVIIDAGNILARAFYNNIEIPNDDNLEYHTISQGIVMHVNPQRILGSDLFQPKYSTSTPENPIPPGKVDNGYAATILGMACAVNITLGITFLSVALLFVGRVVGLWFLMIFSPFALASIAVPNGKSVFKGFSWSGWLDQLMSLSFMAPVFLFFLFLLIMFLQVIFQTNVSDADKSTSQLLMAVIIPFAMVIFILNKAKSVATDMAGEAGTAVKGIFGKVAGAAVGASLGVTAFAGRAVIGRAASGALQRGNFEARIANAEAVAQDQQRTAAERAAARARAITLRSTQSRAQRLRDSSFDIRNANNSKMAYGAVGAISGLLGKKVIKPIMADFGGKDLDAGKGSKESRAKFEGEKEKEKLKRAEELSKVRYVERVTVVENQKESARGEIKELKEQKEETLKKLDKQTDEITKRLDELVAKGKNTDAERDEIDVLKKKGDEIKKQKIEYTEKQDKKIDAKEKEYNDNASKDDFWIKKEESRRRNLYAGVVDGENLWGSVMGVDNKEIADNIRKGKKSKSDADVLKETIEKMTKEGKEKEGHGKEDKHEAPKSKPSAPSGGGGGGGGGAHPPAGGDHPH